MLPLSAATIHAHAPLGLRSIKGAPVGMASLVGHLYDAITLLLVAISAMASFLIPVGTTHVRLVQHAVHLVLATMNRFALILVQAILTQVTLIQLSGAKEISSLFLSLVLGD